MAERKVAIMREGTGLVYLVTPFNRFFVDYLKATIASSDRRWNPERKVWVISEAYVGEVVPLLREYFPGQDIESDLVEQPETPQNIWDEVFQLVPGESRKRVYFLMAQFVHPDKGGNPVEFKKLDEAYRKYEKGA